MKKYWLEPDVLEFELEYLEKSLVSSFKTLKYSFNRSNLFLLEKRRPIGRFSLGPAVSCLGFAEPVCFII